jgi:hypothetical protein
MVLVTILKLLQVAIELIFYDDNDVHPNIFISTYPIAFWDFFSIVLIFEIDLFWSGRLFRRTLIWILYSDIICRRQGRINSGCSQETTVQNILLVNNHFFKYFLISL